MKALVRTHSVLLARRLSLAMIVLAFLVAASPVWAQGRAASAIQGAARDESGGAMPGVTVTLTSPALQVQQMVMVTDSDGAYAFRNLPPGLYRLVFELAQFQTVVHQEVRLNVGFAAKIDAVMKIGSVTETVTVSGQAPVVDVTTTTAAVNFTKETLDKLPTTHSMWEILAMTPGVTMPQQDIGGSKLGNQIDYKTYGITGQAIPQLEGVDVRQESDTSMSVHFDYNALEESQVKAVANDAEVALNGVNWIAIVKSGGNSFHGGASFNFQDQRLQSSNIDASLRSQGITKTDAQIYLRDFALELGGRVVRDKLWFYTAIRDQRVSNELTGYAAGPGPDGLYLTGDEPSAPTSSSLTNQTLKLSYQMSQNYRLIGFYQRNAKLEHDNGAGRFRPKETALILDFKPTVWKGELQALPSKKLLANVLVGYVGYASARFDQPGADVPGNPSRYFRETGLYTGPWALPYTSLRTRLQSTGSVTYFPETELLGHHSLKAGYSYYDGTTGRESGNQAAGNYLLTFDKVTGVSNQPVELTTYNNPITGSPTRENELGVFVKDTWAISGRLTANLGLRLDRYHAYMTSQTKVQGTFGNSGDFPGFDVLKWTSVAPRVGVAFDLLGNGRNVVKAAYGLFNHSMGDAFAQTYNVNTTTSTTYRWHDLNGNRDYNPGEVNLDVNGSDFLSIAGSANAIVNKDLGQPRTHEASLSFERELMANFSLRTLYVYKRQNNLFESSNVLRPYSAWSIPLNRRDPGPDGILGTADDGGTVTIYDYTANYKGAAFVGAEPLNASGSDYYHNIEVTLNKRQSQNWDMLLSVLATKNHRQLDYVPDSPNDQYNRLDTTWYYQFKLTASYRLPLGINMAAFYTQRSGDPLQRTYTFRAVDPAGGPALKQQTTVTLRLEPFGARRLPTGKLLNFRVGKDFSLGGSRRLGVTMDIFNALNKNAAMAMVVASGPSFGSITQITPPRIVRVGVAFKF